MATVRQRSLTEASWQQLLAFVAPDASREQAGARYECIRDRLISFFRWRGASSCDVLADRVLDRVAQRLLEDAVPDRSTPERYVLGVARRVLLEEGRSAAREREAARDLAAARVWTINAVERERYAQALETCLEQCPSPDVDLFRRYHQAGRGRDRIAARAELAAVEGVAQRALRVRMHRVRKLLLDCVSRCVGKGPFSEEVLQ